MNYVRKVLNLLSLIFLFNSAIAQVPQKMGFQAVIRDASNTLIVNQKIGMRVSIIQGSITGNSVYTETHQPTTNINGLVSLEIGTGVVVSGDFASINWSKGLYYVKNEVDPSGGNIYSIASTSQLLSVPYAFHSKTADSVLNPIASNAQFVLKQNDEEKASDTLLLDDLDLFFNLSSNSTYNFEFFIRGDNPSKYVVPKPSWQGAYTINFNGSLSNFMYYPFIQNPGSSWLILSTTRAITDPGQKSSNIMPTTIGPSSLLTSQGLFYISIKGIISTGQTGGKLSFAWAPVNIRPLPLIIYKNSYGILTKVN